MVAEAPAHPSLKQVLASEDGYHPTEEIAGNLEMQFVDPTLA